MKHVVIIGNGIAGVTAARYIRKLSDHTITMISAESEYFFSRTALMYVFMGHMQWRDIQPYENWFWSKNRINLIQAYVYKVDTQNKKLSLSSGKDVHYDELILATGSTFNKFGWPGQDLEGVNGLYSKQDLDYLEEYAKDTKAAAIVGGGLIGIELAEMFASRGIKVHFLVRETSYWRGVLPPEESAMINRHINEHHIDLQLGTELKEILSDEAGRCRAILTSKGEEIPVQYVGLTAGVHPNISFLADTDIETQKGILVDSHLRTNVENVYAIGDCAQIREPRPGRRPIEAIWYTGKMMGETVAMNICGNAKEYDPGIFYNSAKFFDIEYHIYGDVPAKWPDNVASLYWEHKDGRKAIRINYELPSRKVLGFHLMGIRYRHKVCERWIAEEKSLDYVMQNLAAANFDPEFFRHHEKDLLALYNKQNPDKPVKLKSKRSVLSQIFG